MKHDAINYMQFARSCLRTYNMRKTAAEASDDKLYIGINTSNLEILQSIQQRDRLKTIFIATLAANLPDVPVSFVVLNELQSVAYSKSVLRIGSIYFVSFRVDIIPDSPLY